MNTAATAQASIPVSPRESLRALVRGAYDIQRLRIMTGNRIVAQFKAKLGQKPSESEEELDDDSVEILDQLRADFKLMMDGVKSVKLATFKATPLISNFTEFALLQQYLDLDDCEKRHFVNIGKVLKEHRFTADRREGEPECVGWLARVKGVGPAMAGVILSEIDIHKAKYPSSLWQYCGLGVEADGRGTSRKAEHLHDVTYTDKDGKQAIRKGIRFNPFIKTKLMGVLASSFLRVGDSPYRVFYDQYKHRLETREGYWSEESKGHRHNASLRYMVKRFLVDCYIQWRTLEGLPVAPEYNEARRGHVHGAGPQHVRPIVVTPVATAVPIPIPARKPAPKPKAKAVAKKTKPGRKPKK